MNSNTKIPSVSRLPSIRRQSGKLGYILLWLVGVPVPILLVIYLLRGCS